MKFGIIEGQFVLSPASAMCLFTASLCFEVNVDANTNSSNDNTSKKNDNTNNKYYYNINNNSNDDDNNNIINDSKQTVFVAECIICSIISIIITIIIIIITGSQYDKAKCISSNETEPNSVCSGMYVGPYSQFPVVLCDTNDFFADVKSKYNYLCHNLYH